MGSQVLHQVHDTSKGIKDVIEILYVLGQPDPQFTQLIGIQDNLMFVKHLYGTVVDIFSNDGCIGHQVIEGLRL